MEKKLAILKHYFLGGLEVVEMGQKWLWDGPVKY